MSNSPSPAPGVVADVPSSAAEQARKQKKQLNTARFCLAASLLLAGVIAYLFPYTLLYIVPAALPYLVNLILLPGPRALAWATAIGAVGLVGPLWGFVFAASTVSDPYRDWEYRAVLPVLGLLLASHVALIASARRYRRLQVPADGKRPRGVTILAIGYFFFVIIFVGVSLPGMYRDRKLANESSAVGSVRTLETALDHYQASYPKIGYPKRLADLGGPQSWRPGPNAAGFVDETLACAQPTCSKSGYSFEYKPSAKGGATNGYEISARPLAYNHSGVRSFFSEQDGVIHFTRERRPATARDPALGEP
jgi:hypothetical protein